jgi:hypothetical protein
MAMPMAGVADVNTLRELPSIDRAQANEITRSAPIRRRIANFMMDHPTDAKSSSETCVAGVRSAEVWR